MGNVRRSLADRQDACQDLSGCKAHLPRVRGACNDIAGNCAMCCSMSREKRDNAKKNLLHHGEIWDYDERL